MSKLIFSKTLSHNGNMQMSMNNCEIVFSKMSTVPDVNSRFGQRQFSLISVDHIRLRYQFNPSNFWHMRHTNEWRTMSICGKINRMIIMAEETQIRHSKAGVGGRKFVRKTEMRFHISIRRCVLQSTKMLCSC